MFKCKHKNIIKKYKRETKFKEDVLVYYEYCNDCKKLLRGGVSFIKPTIENIVKTTECAKIENSSSISSEVKEEDKKTLGNLLKNTVKQREALDNSDDDTVVDDKEIVEEVVEVKQKESYFKRRDRQRKSRKDMPDELKTIVKGTKDRKRKRR